MPLAGLRVLELGQLVAGPFAGSMLASFGAEVVKVEPPSGDPLRTWRRLVDGTSLWWYAMARNKRSITCNLREVAGRDLIRRLLSTGFDIVIENFRPGRMEAWGLGPDDLWAIDPRIVMVRISGYGQTGPHADRPGFANIAEAVGGLRYTTGEPGRPPVRTGVSLGDTLAGLHGAYGAMTAVYERDKPGGSGKGQVVDVALAESVLNMMESLIPEYDRLGHVRQPCGAGVEGIVPSGSYPCADGRYVAIGANADRLFKTLMRTIGRADLADDPALCRNDLRVPHAQALDAAIAAWTATLRADQVLDALRTAEVPCGPIQSAADIVADPQLRARNMLIPMTLPDGTAVTMPGVVPTLSRTPGHTDAVGPAIGAHNKEVYGALGIDATQLQDLRNAGVI